MNPKKSLEPIRSFNLSIPFVSPRHKYSESSTLKTKDSFSIRSSEFEMLSSSSNISTVRPAIFSYDASSIHSFDDKIKKNSILPFISKSKALKYLPFIYAQNGYKKTNDFIKKIDGEKMGSCFPIKRKESCLNIFESQQRTMSKSKQIRDFSFSRYKSFDYYK